MPYLEFSNYKKKIVIKSFSEATDEEITDMLNALAAGSISYDKLVEAGWTVGAERSVSLSAMSATGVSESHTEQDQTLVILHGKDMYDLSNGGKNNFVIGLKNCLFEPGYINSTNTNVGGWNSSARRSWCDNIFKSALPSEVQKWFKKFKYKVSAGNASTTIETLENYFTFSAEIEVFGTTSYSVSGEGTQFDYYKTTGNRLKKLVLANTNWWERSPVGQYADGFCAAQNNDSTGTVQPWTSASNNKHGLSPYGVV